MRKFHFIILIFILLISGIFVDINKHHLFHYTSTSDHSVKYSTNAVDDDFDKSIIIDTELIKVLDMNKSDRLLLSQLPDDIVIVKNDNLIWNDIGLLKPTNNVNEIRYYNHPIIHNNNLFIFNEHIKTHEYHLSCFNRFGKLVWDKVVLKTQTSTYAIGEIYANVSGDTILAVTSSSDDIWMVKIDGTIVVHNIRKGEGCCSGPVIDSMNNFIINDYAGYVYSISPHGILNWKQLIASFERQISWDPPFYGDMLVNKCNISINTSDQIITFDQNGSAIWCWPMKIDPERYISIDLCQISNNNITICGRTVINSENSYWIKLINDSGALVQEQDFAMRVVDMAVDPGGNIIALDEGGCVTQYTRNLQACWRSTPPARPMRILGAAPGSIFLLCDTADAGVSIMQMQRPRAAGQLEGEQGK